MFMRKLRLLSTLETIQKFYNAGTIDEDQAVELIDSRIRQDNIEKEIEFNKEMAEKYIKGWKTDS